MNTESDVIKIFVPMKITKRGGTAIVIVPKNIDKDDMEKNFDERIIKAFSKAHRWKKELDEGKIGSLADIARREKITGSYVSRVFNLNFIAPEIIREILNGTQPRTLKLQDMLIGKIPELWQEQKELWGF